MSVADTCILFSSRSGCEELFTLLEEKHIPLLIFSAGLLGKIVLHVAISNFLSLSHLLLSLC
jgi:hypothetical protein